MKSWNRPGVPALPGASSAPRIWDTASAQLVTTKPSTASGASTASGGSIAGIYVCGITPYDATHIGHAATYLAYDTLIRLWLDAGFDVRYVQNTTDVDDPLLERATATGVDWQDLAAQQTDLFRADMEALAILPPDHYVAVTEMIEPTAEVVKALLDRDIAYYVEDDIYFDSDSAATQSPWTIGDESNYDRATMLALSAERGGDPQRVGKRDPLDPLLWRNGRAGEPSWQTVLGRGRPGWHIECSVIAETYLDLPITVQAGGSDLIFPHHEFSAGHAAAATGSQLARVYSHAGLVAYQGEKMSKSLGNLVFVSKLTAAGVDPRAIRLAILAQHYRRDWEWTDALLDEAQARLERWLGWAEHANDRVVRETALLAEVRALLGDDLNSAGAMAAIDASVAAGVGATVVDLDAIDALLGVRLH
ncbi:L-cysteine:1D-myo-inositol 2-amino-2-deoxy-alpha-D-glucopyranoside ligase [Glaciihabitans tibetensis]|uniref:L-cysteine:1D-myo-inositol 2-amino-2-deoxy-alpha-D-glucopyranoside ligase n=1 Tax=Glaciihabitans tibetensis TaxID=1266600 RepID=A0A2T0VJZ4_9MICO|nr:cysteine--1-D-myo-inosityl 2-amino-2-deoxy-alpha-D-glucopyranoside ligase [Glaciihabitans tibetensis]PRY70551.1 L-cysteine:1D-myo-inositol 2-amino-2-deoxy-alpha-D-glucopyranoside ligase [Glaciihabitans tibetensis]